MLIVLIHNPELLLLQTFEQVGVLSRIEYEHISLLVKTDKSSFGLFKNEDVVKFSAGGFVLDKVKSCHGLW